MMGKKMGINTKAVEARERRDAQKKSKKETDERLREDAFWRDDDKQVNRKLDRQKERELKLQQERDRKAANKAAYERDMELAEQSAKSKQALASQSAEPKLTRHVIDKKLEEERAKEQNSKSLKNVNVTPIPLVPNFNRLDDGESASNINQALNLFQSH